MSQPSTTFRVLLFSCFSTSFLNGKQNLHKIPDRGHNKCHSYEASSTSDPFLSASQQVPNLKSFHLSQDHTILPLLNWLLNYIASWD